MRSTPVRLALALAACAPSCATKRVDPGPVPESPAAPNLVSLPTADGGLVQGLVYGVGDNAVVLAHGAQFDKENWEPQARVLARSGFQVLAIDFRGYNESRGGTESKTLFDGLALDVLAAVRHLRDGGASSVSVVGASMGGGAAAEASIRAEPGLIDRLVLLAHSPVEHPELMKGRKLFVVSKKDLGPDSAPRLVAIREQFQRAPEPKQFVILEGDAHAQFIFDTDQGERLLEEILRFLSAP